jgi:hypothetical protein
MYYVSESADYLADTFGGFPCRVCHGFTSVYN